LARKITHTAAFAHFGTKPRNVQWSWSARSDDGNIVVVTLWQDQFTRENGRVVYARNFPPEIAARPGFRELMDNLSWARDHCDGRFNVIVAIPKNRNAEPRSIAECFPSKMVMKLTHLNAAAGEFVAEAEGL